MSYDFNAKNFLQLNTTYTTENWQGKHGIEALNNFYNSISETRFSASLKYQYAITPHAQVYAQYSYHTYNSTQPEIYQPFGSNQQPHLHGARLGFTYFLH